MKIFSANAYSTSEEKFLKQEVVDEYDGIPVKESDGIIAFMAPYLVDHGFPMPLPCLASWVEEIPDAEYKARVGVMGLTEGDSVVLKASFDGVDNTTEGMATFCGKTMTVFRAYPEGCTFKEDQGMRGDGGYYWQPQMFDHVVIKKAEV